MLTRLRGVFRRTTRSSKKKESLVLRELDFSWLDPPENPLDVEAWDHHWTEHARHGFGSGLYDMMIDDRDLVRVMQAEGMETVLCAGNGISLEPRALAEAGFRVVALDQSSQAMAIARAIELSDQVFERFCEPEMRRPGGHADFVVGDFLEPAVCPGPFDVIIERRTAQLFKKPQMERVLATLASRLGPDGILLSHCHDAAWKPPGTPKHATEVWFEENNWEIWRGGSGEMPKGSLAWLYTTTG